MPAEGLKRVVLPCSPGVPVTRPCDSKIQGGNNWFLPLVPIVKTITANREFRALLPCNNTKQRVVMVKIRKVLFTKLFSKMFDRLKPVEQSN